MFELELSSQDTKTNKVGDKMLDLCHSLEITTLYSLFDQKGGEFTYVSHSGSSVVDYFAICDELIEILPVLSVAERSESKESKHFPLEMEVDVYDYNVTVGSAICKIESKNIIMKKMIWDGDRCHQFVQRL